MRDDLHRTVPFPRPCSGAACLSPERWTAEELAPPIAATVQQDQTQREHPSGGVISLAISQVGGDLFDNGAEKLRLTLQSLQDGPLSVMERATCEAALGILSTRGLTEDFAAEVAQAVGFAHARDSVEHMLNRVAVVHGRDQAAQARQC